MKYVVAVGRRDLAKGPKVQKSEVQHSALGEAAARGQGRSEPLFLDVGDKRDEARRGCDDSLVIASNNYDSSYA